MLNLSFFDEMALSTYSSMEKQSLYQLLCGAMIVDGNRDPREISIINEVKRVMNITPAEIEASRKLTEAVMDNCLRNMDKMKKLYVGKFMAQVILADGVVTQKEELFFNYIRHKLDIPDPH